MKEIYSTYQRAEQLWCKILSALDYPALITTSKNYAFIMLTLITNLVFKCHENVNLKMYNTNGSFTL